MPQSARVTPKDWGSDTLDGLTATGRPAIFNRLRGLIRPDRAAKAHPTDGPRNA